MSILIKGMEMPKSCIWREGKCPLLGDDDDCKLQDCQEDWTWEDQYKGCPLSEAPEPCEDAVSRKAVRFILPRMRFKGFDEYRVSLDLLDKLPSITPKRKTGKWITESLADDFAFVYSLKCSECGKYYGWEHNFCPNCGADMRGKQNEPEKKGN